MLMAIIALTRTLNDYAKKNNFLKNEEALTGEDVREGITAVVSVKLHDPQFEGQTNDKLGNSEVEGIVNSLVGEGLKTYLEENPQVNLSFIHDSIKQREMLITTLICTIDELLPEDHFVRLSNSYKKLKLYL